MSVKVMADVGGGVVASGGTTSDIVVGGVPYRVHTFTTSDDFVVSQGGEVEYLIVAGGGGGGAAGNGASTGAGGGGAGGLLTSLAAGVSPILMSSGTYAVTVGQGGVGNAKTGDYRGSNGGNSAIGSLVTAVGGGGGGSGQSNTALSSGKDGGSGGGTGWGFLGPTRGLGTSGQGNDGGQSSALEHSGAGGGGAGQAGSPGSTPAYSSGAGGDGLEYDIDGTAKYYAGGGGGADYQQSPSAGGAGGGGAGGAPGFAGTDGFGGGGGAGRRIGNLGYAGGDGGDGVVIIRYPLTTDITGNTTSVSVTRGRRDETEPFQTGRATLTVRNLDGTYDPEGTPFQLRDPVTVSWEGNGTAVPVFTGFVEDVTLGYDLSGDAQVQVSCVDGFALLANQTIVDEAVSVEDSGARIGTVLANAGVAWPAGTSIATGISQLAAGTADGNALQYLRQVEESEQGYLYVARDGTLTFKNRHTTLNNPIAGTQFSDDGGGIPYEAVERFSGARSLFNKVTGELEDGTARQADDLVSQSDFSIRTLDLGTVLLESVTTLEDFVEYLLNQFATPATRVDALTVNLDRLSESDAEKLAQFELADICDVEFTPPGRSQFTNQLLVQGVQHRVTVGGAWRVDLSFQRRDTRAFLILDDSVQGKLDENLLAF